MNLFLLFYFIKKKHNKLRKIYLFLKNEMFKSLRKKIKWHVKVSKTNKLYNKIY